MCGQISAYARIGPVRTLLKSLIVWLLLLAIPFQGFASATMLVCAPMQSVPQTITAFSPSTMQHDHRAMLSRAGTEALRIHNASVTAKVSQAEAGHQTTHHHAGGKCNSCATCCFGASMAPTFTSVVAAEAQNFAVISFEVDHVASVDLALPERPPQTSLT
jgi:uncharacterized protein YpuA (DUF1002 family)